MKTLPLLLAGALLLPAGALAQYDGPAVEACRQYALKESALDAARIKDVHFDRDQSLVIERYTRKLGSQFVSSILTGNGAVVYDNSPSAELAFICLLADEKRPLFFQWLVRRSVSPLAQCTRHPGVRGRARDCLKHLLQTAEFDMIQIAAERFQQAREKDVAGKNEAFSDAYRKAAAQWREYRDAECTRRRAYAPQGVHPDDVQLACIIELTRRRRLDLQ